MPTASEKGLRIAVVLDRSEEVQMSLWFHAQRHLRQIGSCVFSLFSPDRDSLRRLAGWRPDGVVGYFEEPGLLESLLRLGRPVVNVSGALDAATCPTVCPDNEAIGRMAGQYLLARNCCHFGFVGVGGRQYSRLQLEGLGAAVAPSGRGLSAFAGKVHPLPTVPPTPAALRRNRPLMRWLDSLPEATGLLIVDSWLGMRVCDMALAAGIDLLQKFAIVTGHDCDVPSVPSLSGVHIVEQQWSCQAVELLLGILAGDPAAPGPVLIQPTGVNERGSTSRTMVTDPRLRDALIFIQHHAESVIGVDDVAAAATISRRSLERLFRSQLNRSVLAEIHRVHLAQARRLLVETDLTVETVAHRSGLTDARQLLRLFRKREGCSPGTYRKQFRTA
ncbi:MAG: helix-turn-helix domain-containing protein [Planctomycetota bacterium]